MAGSDTRSDVVALARELVAVPSHEDEYAAGERVADWLRTETGAAVEHGEFGVVARKRPDGWTGGHGSPVASVAGDPADRVALVGHHDVVPPDDAQVDGGDYRVRIEDGRLYGRGSADMKGSLAAAMVAFRNADAACTFASFAGEEQGGVGCRAAIDAGFVPERAVVGEGSTGYSAPGVTDVAVAHKGRRGVTLVTEGVAAHASEPEAGENAVYRAVDAVNAVRDLEAPTATVLGHDLTGSVVVTGIEGGSAWNVVPERCSITIDERTVPGDRADLERAAGEGVDVTVDQDLPPMACPDDDFANAVLAAAGEVQDGAGAHVVKPHATDAGWLAAEGTACVVCGAAEPGEAHTASESVSLSVLERCAEVYRVAVELAP